MANCTIKLFIYEIILEVRPFELNYSLIGDYRHQPLFKIQL